MVFTPEGGGAPERMEIFTFDKPGVALGMYNTEESITGFAKACFGYALDRKWYAHLPEESVMPVVTVVVAA